MDHHLFLNFSLTHNIEIVTKQINITTGNNG